MKEFIVAKNLKMTMANLQNVKFQTLSPTARQILRRSKVHYKSALLDSDQKGYQQAALGLAKEYFLIKKAR
jgi:hypothetical protein